MLQPSSNDRCPLCRKPSLRGFLCLWCREKSPLLQVIAAVRYDERCRKIIHRIKFGRVSACIPPLAFALTDAWQRFGAHAGTRIAVPIPLHPRRLADRGFNQAALLARNFCARAGMSFAPKLIKRVRATRAQAELNESERSDNVSDAFLCPDPSAVRGTEIVLIDDVVTTGATLHEAAQALHAAGAREVRALTFAHG